MSSKNAAGVAGGLRLRVEKSIDKVNLRQRVSFDEARLLGSMPRLYDALAAPDEWPALLSEMSASVGAEGALILNHATSQACYPSSERMRTLVSAYVEDHWAARNPWPQRMKNRGLVKSIATEWNLFSPEELKRLPIYNEVALQHGFSSFMTVVLSEDNQMTTLTFARTPVQGPFTESELEAFAKVLPGLHHFGSFAGRLGTARDAGTADLLDQMGDGAILIGSDGRVLHVNSAAKQYLNDAFGIDSGCVYALHADAADQLRSRIAQALDALRSQDVNATAGTVLLPRIAGRPIVAEIVPLRRAVGDLFRKASAIVIFRDPDRRVSVDEDTCRHLFGLSPAEARLASALGVGEDIAGFAKTSGLAVDTVRKRAKSLLAKTGTRRQAELAVLLGRLRRDVISNAKDVS